MNKQIKSFLAECGAELVQDTHNGQSGLSVELPANQMFDFEKFVELIIKECESVIEDYGLSLLGSDEHYLGETLNLSIKVQEASTKIKQHFGIAE